ncbi:MAG: competence protein CoiA family protein [Desulfosporosinus sp.]|nr:competence protein CoiA family protein [Desulfosporosinus sp.]
MDIKIPFGLREGKIVHISDIAEVERGLRCRCICPQCHSILIAKLGVKNVHHFAHQNVDCPFALETALHLFAKQVLEETKYIHLPKVAYYWHAKETVMYPESILYFDSVTIETRFGTIVPDIILRKGRSELIVEIKVTHEIDSDKFDKIFSMDISTVEIDLSSFDNTNFNKAVVTRAIIQGLEYKEWIYNSKAMAEEERQQKIYEKDQAELNIQRAKEEEELKRQRALNHSQKLIRVQRLLDLGTIVSLRNRWEKEIADNPLWIDVSKGLSFTLFNLPKYLNSEIEGELVFNCDRRIWQALLFRVFCIGSNQRSSLVGVKSVIEWLKKKPYPLPLNWDMMYLKDLPEYSNHPGIAEVICEFFLILTQYGLMKPTDRTLATRGAAYYWWFERISSKSSQKYQISTDFLNLHKEAKIVELQRVKQASVDREERELEYKLSREEQELEDRLDREWDIEYRRNYMAQKAKVIAERVAKEKQIKK